MSYQHMTKNVGRTFVAKIGKVYNSKADTSKGIPVSDYP